MILFGFTYIKGDDHDSTSIQYLLLTNDSLIQPISTHGDSVVTVAVGKHYKHGSLYNFFLGKHYREIWAQPIEIKVFDIGRSEEGNLSIGKKGGGFQTLSLRLSNSQNRKFVIRTIDKDESTVLPPLLRKTFIKGIFKDQTSALNPYAALVIPPLAQAAGLYHTNPRLYFVPYDERFGQYAKEFEKRVVIFEEYPDSSWANTSNFGFARDIINSEHLLKKRFEDQNVKIDNKMMAKARLFDIWIGDWDRHIDQWRWAEFKQDKYKIYKPIGRDRDMAFFKLNDSGIISVISTKINNKLQTFNYDYGNLHGLTKSGRYIDHLFLTGLTEEDFIEIADSLKNQLNDEVIEKAIAAWPDIVYEKEGKEIISKLKTRRNNLPIIASTFFKQIAKEALVVGTDEEESIEIIRMNNNTTLIKMYDKENTMVFNQLFSNDITEVVSIYMLGGNDKISISGKVKKGIDIEIFGGKGNDLVTDHSEVKGLRKRTKIYDSISGNTIDFGSEAEDKTSDNLCILDFDRKGVRKK